MIAQLVQSATGLAAAAQTAGAHLPERVPFAEYMESWHEFYLMTGTAAVTLAGLLFVALSLHLEQLVEESHAHLLALSRTTLTTFVLVLTASLMLLTPAFSQRISGLMLVTVGAVGFAVSIRVVATTRHRNEGGFSRGAMRRRNAMSLSGYGLMVATGAGLWLGIQELLNWAIPSFCMLLGNAAGTSFELLVQVARDKRLARELPRA